MPTSPDLVKSLYERWNALTHLHRQRSQTVAF
jgi:hypothetical protein